MPYPKKSQVTPSGFYAQAQLPPPPPPASLPPAQFQPGVWNTSYVPTGIMFQQSQFLYNYSNMRQPHCPIPPPPPPKPPAPAPSPAPPPSPSGPLQGLSTTIRIPDGRRNITRTAVRSFPHGSAQPTSSSLQHSRSEPSPLLVQQMEYKCESCKLVLDSPTALHSHMAGHIKCRACSFEGSPKVVKGHFEATHGKFAGRGWRTITVAVHGCPVQRFRICVGNHPDDVQQWIADRKKRFPRTSKQPQQKPSAITASRLLPKGNPPSSNETDVGSTQYQQDSLPSKPAIACLLDGYGSSSSSGSESCTEDSDMMPTTSSTSPVPRNERKHPSTPSSKVGVSFSTDALADALTPTATDAVEAVRTTMRKTATPFHGRSTELNKRYRYKASPPASLLRKLLANDVRRDVAITLQLLDYIVESNFLQDNNTNSNKNGMNYDRESR